MNRRFGAQSLTRQIGRPATRFGLLAVLLLAALIAGASITSTAIAGGSPFSTAQWIAPPPAEHPHYGTALLRREFTLDHAPRRAVVRIVGLGDYDPALNGRRLSPLGINQPWSQYERTLYYRDFDARPHLRRGANVLGVTLTHSFWDNAPAPGGRYFKRGPQRMAGEPLLLLAELEIEQADGTVRRIVTDERWRTRPGPITFSHLFAGEDFDARLLQPGWDAPGFEARHWTPVRIVPAPPGELLPQTWPPVLPRERFAPQRVVEPAPGVWLYHFPQNCAAQLRVVLSGGVPGARIQARAGEHKNAQDRLFGGYVVGCEWVTDGRRLTNQWSSFYLGMQFVEITGAVPKGRPNPGGLPVIESLELVHVRAALPEAGAFSSSSAVFDGTHRIVDWAMQANANHVLTDCPHREKLGWLEVAYLMAPSFLYRYDSGAWFRKILRDIRDAQEPSGRVLTVAPSYPAGRFPDKFNWTVEWGAAAALLPWHLYEWSGDAAVLVESFDMMRRFTDYVGTEARDGLAPGGLGDWYDYGHGQPPGESRFTPAELTATATWALCARAVARAAEVLGRSEDARRFRGLHARIAADFRRHFLDPDTRRLRHRGSPQTANAIALCADLLPGELRPVLMDDLIADLQARDWQQTTGDVGHVYLIRALAEAGRSDVLHRVYAREGKGSYGGILAKDLTSMPETWDAMMDGRQSLNHCMLGHVMEWFYGSVGGIRQQPGTVGWRNLLIAPAPGPLTHARVEVRTPRGSVVSDWTIRRGRFRLTAEVPRGVEASAILPSGAVHPLHAGRQTLSEPWPR